MLIVTDLETYLLDLVNEKFVSSKSDKIITSVQEANVRVTDDFISAIINGRETFASGKSLLPSIKILQKVQNNWDAQNQKGSIPGRREYG